MREIKTDVLVIGGGIAGVWSSIKASEKTHNVIVADKGYAGRTGHSALSAGAMVAVRPQDDLPGSVDDLVRAQEGFISRRVAEFILGNSFDRVKDLESWGVQYLMKDGDYFNRISRGSKCLRIYYSYVNGQGNLQAAIGEAKKRGVKIINRMMITDLLTDGGRVTGALGMDTRSGEVCIFNAKATIIAANTTGFRGLYFACDMVGDGPMLAYRGGAEIENAEFNVVNTGSPVFHFEGTGPAAALGAKFKNTDGEAFMARYYPEDKDSVDTGYLNKAMSNEVKEGRGPIYFDFTQMNESFWDSVKARKFNFRMLDHSKVEKWGIDHNTPEWMPAHQYNMGAIRADFGGATSLPGLFAAGKARSGIGIALMTGWSWCSCIGSGYIAGEKAGEYAVGSDFGRIDKAQAGEFEKRLFEPLKREPLHSADELTEDIQRTVIPWDVMIIKNEKRLQNALDRIAALRDEKGGKMSAPDYHELVKVKETENMLLNAEIFLRASLLRKESRQGHYREDYPDRDDANWLKSVVAMQGKNGQIELGVKGFAGE